MSMIRGYGPKKPAAKKKRRPIPFARVTAEVQVEASKEVHEARVLLSDLSAAGVAVFIDTPLERGEKVALVIEQPKHLYLRGEIVSSNLYTLDKRIITSAEFRYRVGIQFQYDSPEERKAIEDYCAELNSKDGTKAA